MLSYLDVGILWQMLASNVVLAEFKRWETWQWQLWQTLANNGRCLPFVADVSKQQQMKLNFTGQEILVVAVSS